jgi:hypothetical protein
MSKKKDKFDMNDPKWGGTMRDVRDSLARGEGLNDKPYPYDGNPNNAPSSKGVHVKKERKGCLSFLFGGLW